MNISIVGEKSNAINIGCQSALLSNTENALIIKFETDAVARSNEEVIKTAMNGKTKHCDKEITILNINDYKLAFS